jgi:hypothetical protein
MRTGPDDPNEGEEWKLNAEADRDDGPMTAEEYDEECGPDDDHASLIEATVNLFDACRHLVLFLEGCRECRGSPDNPVNCSPCEEAEGCLAAGLLLASSLESCQGSHKKIRHAAKHLMDERLAAFERDAEQRRCWRPWPLPTIVGEN